MQPFTQKYSIVHFFEPLPMGNEFAMTEWPPHVALADVFGINGDPQAVLHDLAATLNNNRSFTSQVHGEEWFGADKSVHVMLVNNTPELQELHETILEVLGHYSAVFNTPQYTRSGFRPHSTIQKSSQLNDGDTVTFDSITLIDMFPGGDPYQRRVLGTVSFL